MKILFVTGYSIDSMNLNANAICIKELIEALRKEDIQVKVIGNTIFEEAGPFDWKKNPMTFFQRISKWPSINPIAEKVCFEEIEGSYKGQDYDAVIVSHKPFEVISATCKWKKRHPQIRLFIYSLDPISNEIDSNIGMGKYLSFITKHVEREVFKTADCIFNMECNRKKYSAATFLKFQSKFNYLDFPIIKNKGYSASVGKSYCGEKLRFVYSGALDQVYRSPAYFLEVLKIISCQVPMEMFFFSKGNCEKLLESISKRYIYIKANGYIPKNELQDILEQSDYLINIGNKYSEMLPSKLLTYFEMGKPIIHISNQKHDVCVDYMYKYPLGLVIYEHDSVLISAQKIQEFINQTYKKKLDSNTICDLYQKNTPNWSAKRIKETILSHY